MDLKTYQKEAKRTLPELSTQTDDINHMLLGMLTEIGELADIFKKNQAYGKEIDWINASEEVADIMWYLVNFCSITGINLESALNRNIEKLKTRYPDKFSSEKALNRDLQKERDILEGGSNV